MEEVEEFTYLGGIVNIEGGTDADVKNRIDKIRVIFIILGKAWNVSNILRGTQIFNSNVNAVFLYGQKHGDEQRPCCKKSKDSSTTA